MGVRLPGVRSPGRLRPLLQQQILLRAGDPQLSEVLFPGRALRHLHLPRRKCDRRRRFCQRPDHPRLRAGRGLRQGDRRAQSPFHPSLPAGAGAPGRVHGHRHAPVGGQKLPGLLQRGTGRQGLRDHRDAGGFILRRLGAGGLLGGPVRRGAARG